MGGAAPPRPGSPVRAAQSLPGPRLLDCARIGTSSHMGHPGTSHLRVHRGRWWRWRLCRFLRLVLHRHQPFNTRRRRRHLANYSRDGDQGLGRVGHGLLLGLWRPQKHRMPGLKPTARPLPIAHMPRAPSYGHHGPSAKLASAHSASSVVPSESELASGDGWSG